MKLEKAASKWPEVGRIFDRVREADGIDKFYPPQADALKKGLLDGKNMVLSVPTASGKTLIAELAIMKHVLQGKKGLYLVPLRALASEKYEDLKAKYGDMAKVVLSTGDYDSKDPRLGDYDIIILTFEKMDSLLRHGVDWLRNVGVVVLDEVHLLDSVNRGPTLEMVIVKLRRMVKCQLLALSATIQNSEELGAWLDARVVESDFRPVKLWRGIYFDGEITFEGRKQGLEGTADPSVLLAKDTVKNKGQSLVFVNTRKSAEAEAEKLGKAVRVLLDGSERQRLDEIADKIMGAFDPPTFQCKRLADVVRNGSAFHHAGLGSKQRELVEKGFKSNLIKVISATPTLAMGVNLPGKRVVVRDWKRYGSYGMEPLPVLEINQLMGRAGRPKYDKEGEAVLLAKSLPEYDKLWEHYIEGQNEPISSKLGVEPVLRTHVLGLLAQEWMTKDELYELFGDTFYSYQFGHNFQLQQIINNVLDSLFEWGFIEEEDLKFRPTKLGQRIAELYIDPLTAHELIVFFGSRIKEDIVFATVLADSGEMRPLRGVRQSEEAIIFSEFEKYGLEEEQLRAFRMALIFSDWMGEKTENQLFLDYGIAPGILRTKLAIADWLLYASREICVLTGNRDWARKCSRLRKRIKYGVKEELLPLVRVRNIGRVRARLLFNSGITGPKQLKEADPRRVESLIGTKVGKKVRTQLLSDFSRN